MSNEYENVMREYNIPAGVLSAEELRLLKQGGIPLDSDDEQAPEPKIPSKPRENRGADYRLESVKQMYENEMSIRDKQIEFLQAELVRREQLAMAERETFKSEMAIQQDRLLTELRRARSRVIECQGQVPLMKEAVGQIREMAAGLAS